MFTVGDKLGAYTIQRRIGVGGMGEVYLAEHLHIGRKAAIKVLLPELSSRPDIVARFFNEARATGLLRHPGIVEILDCDVHTNGRAYIVMEFLEGETLGRCLARVGRFDREPATAAVAAAIVGQIAAALAAAHAKGIVHRDLKPDNIFLASTPEGETPLRVKILDFGIAKLFGDGGPEARKTRTGSVLGTPLYMSPEQCRGAGAVDHRTDIYSLGCITFELLSGRPPFMREGHGELIIAHNAEPPPALASLVPAVPPPLAALVARMLAKDVAHRPQAMSDVVRAVEGLLGVAASQFAAQIRVSGAGALAGVAEAAPPAGARAPSEPTASAPVDSGVAPATPALPRTLVQAGNTRVLTGSKTTLSQAAAAVPSQTLATRSHVARNLGIGAGALALVGGALFALLSGSRPESRSETMSAPGEAAPPGREPAAPAKAAGARTPTIGRGGTDPPARPPVAAAPVVPAAPPPPRVVTLDLEKAPAGLVVELDGEPAGVPVRMPSGSAVHELKLSAPGFRSEVLEIDGSRDRTIVLNMQRSASAPPAPVKDPARSGGKSADPPRSGGKSADPPRSGGKSADPPRSGGKSSAKANPPKKKNEGFTDL